MRRLAILFSLVFVASSASGVECSSVYLRGGKPSEFDSMAHKALDGRYYIEDIDPATRSFESPKPTAGGMPSAPNGKGGEAIHGYVLIAYVVTVSGHAESATIVEATDSELSKIALTATGAWRFNPGEVDGAAACVVAMQEFKF